MVYVVNNVKIFLYRLLTVVFSRKIILKFVGNGISKYGVDNTTLNSIFSETTGLSELKLEFYLLESCELYLT